MLADVSGISDAVFWFAFLEIVPLEWEYLQPLISQRQFNEFKAQEPQVFLSVEIPDSAFHCVDTNSHTWIS